VSSSLQSTSRGATSAIARHEGPRARGAGAAPRGGSAPNRHWRHRAGSRLAYGEHLCPGSGPLHQWIDSQPAAFFIEYVSHSTLINLADGEGYIGEAAVQACV
jgi:hypothetical protein